MADTSQDQLVSALKNLRLNDNELPSRPGFGTKGKPIKLRSNFFPLSLSPTNATMYEYDVAITPAAGTAARRVKRRIFQLAELTTEWHGGLRGVVAHDHASKVIASKQLSQPLSLAVRFYDEDEAGPSAAATTYTLTFTFTQTIALAPLMQYLQGRPEQKSLDIQPALAALNIILAAHPSRTGHNGGGVMVGRNKFFFPSDVQLPLTGGLEAWRGFYSSVRPAHKQLMVNVNACTTAFYKPQNLADAMIEFQQATFGGRFTAFVKGVRVQTTHLKRRRGVKAASHYTPDQHKFQSDEFGLITVTAYFKKKYSISLRHGSTLPLVDIGGPKKPILLPPEVCIILPNQPYRGKLSDDQTAAMILVACRPPNVSGKDIVTRGLTELGFKGDAAVLKAFGINVGPDMTIVPGRLLPSPAIKYGQGTPEVDERASWNLRNVKFAVGGQLDSMAVLLIRDGHQRDEFNGPADPELQAVLQGFVQMCSKSGVRVGPLASRNWPIREAVLPRKSPHDPTREEAINVIRQTILTLPAKPKPSIVLVVLSSGDKHIYSGVKRLCDSYLDVATICVQSAKIRKEKGQVQYFANVALKVNMKLGGVNHRLDPQSVAWLAKEDTMLVGMDVTHPGPGSVKGTPSIAAVVASIDKNFAQYPATLGIQESRKEMITDLRDMMIERLLLFKATSKVLPARILVYRDGVSEGQFHTVLQEEMPEMRKAFAKVNGGKPYNPKLTIVICGKRHHTRFYPTEAENADRLGNPRPGTVVDRGVTAVYEFDFFLQAHGGLQGQTRPTHYYVVHDENSFDADTLQTLTNSVSYMFARATKAVSLVSPAYYADLACERGRCYLHKLLQGLSGSGSTVTGTTGNEEAEVMEKAKTLWHGGVSGKALKDTMFYL